MFEDMAVIDKVASDGEWDFEDRGMSCAQALAPVIDTRAALPLGMKQRNAVQHHAITANFAWHTGSVDLC